MRAAVTVKSLALAGLKARILLVDHIDPALTADHPAILVPLLERSEGITNLHDTAFWTVRPFRAWQRGAETIQAAPTCQPRKSTGFVRKIWHKSVLKGGMRHLSPVPATLALLVLAGCVARPAPPVLFPPASAPPVAQAPAFPPLPPMGGDEKFQAFVRAFETTAVAAGITPETYNRAMAGIAPVPSLQPIINEQPEFVRPVWAYLDGAVSPRRIARAKELLAQNATLLSSIEARTGVPKEILVAIWGMETDYGRDVGSYNVFATLLTQA